METKLLTSLGKIAGLGGIALGVVLLIFRDFLKQKLLPQAGLDSNQAYHVLIAFLVLTFGIAAIGIVAWIIGQGARPEQPVPPLTLSILVVLVISVLIITVKLTATASSSTTSVPDAKPTTPTPVTVPPIAFKTFSNTLSLHERDVSSSHGVTIHSGFIGLGPEGAWVDLTAEVNGNVLAQGRYPQGASIPLASADCDNLALHVKSVQLRKTTGISDADLRKMGPAGEAFIKRTAFLLLSGKCKQSEDDSPTSNTSPDSEEPSSIANPISDQQSDCVSEKLRKLLPFNVTPADLKLDNYQTALPEAAEKGDYTCVKTIIEKGVNVNEINGMSALMWAAQNGHEKVVRLLLDHGASVNLLSKGGATALSYAAGSNSVSTVKALVEHGADLDIGPSHFTALMSAAYTGNMSIIEFLLSHNANPCIKSENGETAADVAHRQNHPEAEALLRKASCP